MEVHGDVAHLHSRALRALRETQREAQVAPFTSGQRTALRAHRRSFLRHGHWPSSTILQRMSPYNNEKG